MRNEKLDYETQGTAMRIMQAAMAGEEVKLLGTWSSPFVFRIQWALNMKGIEYEFIEEDLNNKSAMLLEYNPIHKKVLVLVHNGKPVAESNVILEYIDEAWKSNPIFPKDPYERAMCRFWSKFGDEKCIPTVWKVFTANGKEQEEARAALTENLKTLEQELQGKRFFGGETIQVTDITLGWIANLVKIAEEILELKIIDGGSDPLLSAWIVNFSNSPIISFPPHDKMLSKFRTLREAFLPSAGPKWTNHVIMNFIVHEVTF